MFKNVSTLLSLKEKRLAPCYIWIGHHGSTIHTGTVVSTKTKWSKRSFFLVFSPSLNFNFLWRFIMMFWSHHSFLTENFALLNRVTAVSFQNNARNIALYFLCRLQEVALVRLSEYLPCSFTEISNWKKLCGIKWKPKWFLCYHPPEESLSEVKMSAVDSVAVQLMS